MAEEIDSLMHPKAFFEALREDTASAFVVSPVKQRQRDRGRVWNYSICANPIKKNTGIIFGLNWGGGGDQDIDPETKEVFVYPPQCQMPSGADIGSYRFIQQSLSYLEKYLRIKDLSDVNYTNLCFFRTPSISDLQPDDWKLSLPLFHRFVEYVDPAWLLMMGTSGLPVLNSLALLADITEYSAQQSDRTHVSYSGRLAERPFICVPHPQAQLTHEVRHTLWLEACRSALK